MPEQELTPGVFEGDAAKAARLAKENNQESCCSANRDNVPEHIDVMTIFFDKKQNQVQVSGNIGNLEYAMDLFGKAVYTVARYHMNMAAKAALDKKDQNFIDNQFQGSNLKSFI